MTRMKSGARTHPQTDVHVICVIEKHKTFQIRAMNLYMFRPKVGHKMKHSYMSLQLEKELYLN